MRGGVRAVALAILLTLGLGGMACLVFAEQDRLGAAIYVQDSEPAAALLQQGQLWFAPTAGTLKVVTATSPVTWADLSSADEGGDASIPTGAILFIDSGTCPDGFEEVSALEGKTLVGTLAANADVGETGGADSITPEGENSAPTFTGTAITDVIDHTHPVVDPGHAHVEHQNSATSGGLSGWGARDTSTNTSVATSYSTESATTGITTSEPASGVTSITPAGSVSAPTFTGTAFDNRSAFARVIFCKKA